jgi:Putative ER transporter, 6TM, N-terminal
LIPLILVIINMGSTEDLPEIFSPEERDGSNASGLTAGAGEASELQSLRMRKTTANSVSQSIASRLEKESGNEPNEQVVEDDWTSSPGKLAKRPTLVRRAFKLFWGYFRPYFVLDHLDWDSLKPIIRTFVQFWVSIVFMEITAVDTWLGNAPYLVIIVSVILASGQLPIIVAIILPVLSLVAVLFCLAVSVVVLAINNRILGFPSQESVAIQLVTEGICQDNAELAHCVEEQIFRGHFLTTRTTVITIIGYTFAQVILYISKMINPIFLPGSIVGNIMLMILLFYNNLIPFFKPLFIGVSVTKRLQTYLIRTLSFDHWD